jgi:hypothetical protein
MKDKTGKNLGKDEYKCRTQNGQKEGKRANCHSPLRYSTYDLCHTIYVYLNLHLC